MTPSEVLAEAPDVIHICYLKERLTYPEGGYTKLLQDNGYIKYKTGWRLPHVAVGKLPDEMR